jgi:hypothetical protein
MKIMLIAIAFMAITAIGVGATVSAKPSAAKNTARCDSPSCATMSAMKSAADCASCPFGDPSGCGSCGHAVAAKPGR